MLFQLSVRDANIIEDLLVAQKIRHTMIAHFNLSILFLCIFHEVVLK